MVRFRRTKRTTRKGASTCAVTPRTIPKECNTETTKKEETPVSVVLPTITSLSQFLDVVKNESSALQTQLEGLDRLKDAAKIKKLKIDIETLRRFMFACLALRSSTLVSSKQGNSDNFDPKTLQLLRELSQRQGINANPRFKKIQSALDRANGKSQSIWSEASKALPLHEAFLLAAISAVSTSCPLISMQDTIPSFPSFGGLFPSFDGIFPTFDSVFPTKLSPAFCGYSNDTANQREGTLPQVTSTSVREDTGANPDANPSELLESNARNCETVSGTQEYREEREEARDGADSNACILAERTPIDTLMNELRSPADGFSTPASWSAMPHEGTGVLKEAIVSMTDQITSLGAVWKEQASRHAAAEYGLSCGSNVSLSA